MKIDKLKEHVIKCATDKNFIHSDWFIESHLEIVEKLCNELCDFYEEADRDVVNILVWLHDYGKILAKNYENFHKSDALAISKGRELLEDLGFSKDIIDISIKYVELNDKKMEIDLNQAPIEVKIISSADAAAHFIGPFFSLYIYDNSDKSIEELCESNIKKAQKDWNRKIVLPEVKERFKERYEWILEGMSSLNGKYFLK
ncbi:MAG: HD domain-containing protein [Alphaproteobacteria bacterium]|jgi:hypothetical protein|nr:HD domain-containing protein [Alphaproteobacteria bacterium]